MNNARIMTIFIRLGEIANLIAQMAWVGTANHDNQHFVQLMDEHKRLTDEADSILKS